MAFKTDHTKYLSPTLPKPQYEAQQAFLNEWRKGKTKEERNEIKNAVMALIEQLD